MSDFLARMAARAVGAAPIAQPRPVTLFEDAAHGLEELVEEIAAPPAAPQPPRDTATAEPAPARRDGPARERRAPEPEPPTAARPAPRDSEPDAAASPREELRAPEPAHAEPARAEPERRLPEPPPVTEARPARPHVPEPAPAPLRTPAVAAAPAARAAPAALAPAPPVRGGPPPASEPTPTVRVHIGRLEVRANLQPEPRPPARAPRAPERDEPALSLGEYLRGAGARR